MVRLAWWQAYCEIGDKMDKVVYKQFGGSLKFR